VNRRVGMYHFHCADNPTHQTALGAEVLDHSVYVASFGRIIPVRG
jgi:hypothetical protein